MPSFHVIIGTDLLLVNAPAGGRPGSTLYPGAVDILHKLLQGFSGGLQLKTGKHCWYLTWRQEWQGHYLTEILKGAII